MFQLYPVLKSITKRLYLIKALHYFPGTKQAEAILGKVTHCLISHSQTFGIKALQHSDHLDEAGETFLKTKKIPVISREQDCDYLA